MSSERPIPLWTSALLVGVLSLGACDRPQAAPTAPEEIAEEPVEPAPEQAAIEPTGKVIEIRMYTTDPDDPRRQHVFKPALVSAQVGDTIRFIPSETSHQSSSIAEMLPDGVEGWEGEINEEFSYVLPAPGIYGHQCVPHYAAGMVGIIIVEGEGMTDNLSMAQAAAHPGLGNPEFSALFTQAAERGMLD